MGHCPSEEVLILFGASLPEGEDEQELLDGWTADQVAAHVGACEACRAVVQETSALTATMRDDVLSEPAEPFWDELADEVMRSIDRADATPGADVVPLQPVEPARAPVRRLHWGWAVAAGLLVVLGIGLRWMQMDQTLETTVAETGDEAVGPGDGVVPGALPDRATAEAIAAELGLSLEPVDPVESVQAQVVDVDSDLADSGLAALFDGLDDEDIEVLELAVADDDPLSDLAEFDVEELAAVLVALES